MVRRVFIKLEHSLFFDQHVGSSGPQSRGEGEMGRFNVQTDAGRFAPFLLLEPFFLTDAVEARGAWLLEGRCFQVTRRGVQVHPVNLVAKVNLRLPNFYVYNNSNNLWRTWKKTGRARREEDFPCRAT